MADLLDIFGKILDPAALLLVFAGSLLVALVQVGRESLARLPASFGPLLHARPRADRDAARRAMRRVEHVAHLKGIACADRIATTGRFLTRAVHELANARSVDHFERWAEEELSGRAERHDAAIRGWNAIADAAPALGMAGTIIGLIRMFSHMEDSSAIGPAMAMALMATFYGLIFANIVAGPLAARLAQLSRTEIGWQREIIERMVLLARAEMEAGERARRQPDVTRPRQNAVRAAA